MEHQSGIIARFRCWKDGGHDYQQRNLGLEKQCEDCGKRQSNLPSSDAYFFAVLGVVICTILYGWLVSMKQKVVGVVR